MTEISSKGSRLFKLTPPVVLYGGLVYAGWESTKDPDFELIIFILVMIIAFGLMTLMFWIMKWLYNVNYVDEAYDQGTHLFFKNGRKTAIVPFSDIEDIEFGSSMKSTILIVHVNKDTPLGKKISFMPRLDYLYYDKDNRLDKLLERIEKARKQ